MILAKKNYHTILYKVKELIDAGIPITPMIIGHEMFAIFDKYSDKEIWKKADNIIYKKG